MTQQDKETQPESAETTPTRFLHVREVRFAYRRFGNPAGIPLILLQHFRGSMDNWDLALLNGLAKGRTVITFDNAGVGFSSGEVPDTVAAMAQDALDFLDALGLTQVSRAPPAERPERQTPAVPVSRARLPRALGRAGPAKEERPCFTWERPP